ncbi:ICMT-domain-containing protein [Agrocybe pediades]|nr:ICMT-domain-containing protein [Agrocybe pediades]
MSSSLFIPSYDSGDSYSPIPWSWIFPTIKICLLLATAMSVHVSLSPPNPSVKSEECCSGIEGTDTMFERFVQSITYCSKCMVWAGVLCNIFSVLVHCAVRAATADELPWGMGIVASLGDVTVDSEVVSKPLVVGALVTVVAAALRTWCFRALGPFFTFEITIRPKHELITHGPYAWVRHPSYTGVYLTLTGASLVLASPGTWTADTGVWNPVGGAIACFWAFKCMFAFRGMGVRLRAEDLVLKETFGEVWEEYVRRVPCKFIPGVV